jgi:hypothetical protein
MKRRLALAALSVGATALPFAAAAQTRPLRFIVPYPPGGPLDIVARALAEKVKDSLGAVFIDNKPGAGGNLGAEAVLDLLGQRPGDDVERAARRIGDDETQGPRLRRCRERQRRCARSQRGEREAPPHRLPSRIALTQPSPREVVTLT